MDVGGTESVSDAGTPGETGEMRGGPSPGPPAGYPPRPPRSGAQVTARQTVRPAAHPRWTRRG